MAISQWWSSLSHIVDKVLARHWSKESSTRTHRSPGFSEQGGMGRVSSLLRLVFLRQATRWNDYVVEAASGPKETSRIPQARR